MFINFWSSKAWIRIGIQGKMKDPDPYQKNTDPKHGIKFMVFMKNSKPPEQEI
jgi:hypothetical protein